MYIHTLVSKAVNSANVPGAEARVIKVTGFCKRQTDSVGRKSKPERQAIPMIDIELFATASDIRDWDCHGR